MTFFGMAGRTAVITGAGSGIGAACAPMLGAAGAHAVALDLDRDAAAATANDVGGEAVAADVSDPEAVQRALTAAAARSGAIDVLLNNAGIALDTHCFADTETSHFLRHIEVNMLFVINGIRMGAALRAPRSAIVNTASVQGLFAVPGYVSYAASNCGVVGLTKVAAMELGPGGIRVNAVSPTTVDTPMLHAVPAGGSGGRRVRERLGPGRHHRRRSRRGSRALPGCRRLPGDQWAGNRDRQRHHRWHQLSPLVTRA
ncbi:SDR family NAD(P)-dependent oxidoreductase [Mycolicibacterium obuense]|uniref:SDR family NAD(P)-dependent oxidoreductase n=1 Tax=Mycolicibacterium obuense TaxID=1807 RepID=UPI0009E3BA10|nr:SDR family oxidoreductase [Mycolicibacterium obuense]